MCGGHCGGYVGGWALRKHGWAVRWMREQHGRRGLDRLGSCGLRSGCELLRFNWRSGLKFCRSGLMNRLQTDRVCGGSKAPEWYKRSLFVMGHTGGIEG